MNPDTPSKGTLVENSELSKKLNGTAFQIHDFGAQAIAKSTGSQALDPFDQMYFGTGDAKGNEIIPPPFTPITLARMGEISDILPQCIGAMSRNIPGFGWELRRSDDPNAADDPKELPPEAIEERKRISTFLKYINDRQDIVKLRKNMIVDMETLGYAMLEVIRDKRGNGDIVELHLLPSYTMRICKQDKVETKYKQTIRDEDNKFQEITRYRKFRRYVQLVSGGINKTFFKEFGDPRIISKKTGKVISGQKRGGAHEVIFFNLYSPYTPYGMPRWAGQIMDIIGSRKSSEINYLFFDNKTVPPLIITVSGGALTGESIDKLKDTIENGIKGVESFHKCLILEAVPHSASDIPGEKVTPVRIEVKPLTDYIQKDAMFTDYREKIRTHVRSTFNLAPIYTGDTSDYTRATAFESARVTEEQTFDPERREFDRIFNSTVLTDLKVNFWDLYTLGAKTADLVQIVKSMGMVKEALTVGVMQEAVQEMRKVPRGNIPPELYNETLAQHKAALIPDPIAPEEKDDSEKDVDDDDSSSSNSTDSDDNSKSDS